ncbi:hypothetical protein V2J09_014202 [Rumex salicifolius]
MTPCLSILFYLSFFTLSRSSSSSSASKMAAFPANGRKSVVVKLKAKSLFLPSTILNDCKSLQNISLHNNPILTEEFQQMEGFQEFEARRRKKFDKQIDSNVMMGPNGLDTVTKRAFSVSFRRRRTHQHCRKEEEDAPAGRRRRTTGDERWREEDAPAGRRMWYSLDSFNSSLKTEDGDRKEEEDAPAGRRRRTTEDGDGRRKMEGGAPVEKLGELGIPSLDGHQKRIILVQISLEEGNRNSGHEPPHGFPGGAFLAHEITHQAFYPGRVVVEHVEVAVALNHEVARRPLALPIELLARRRKTCNTYLGSDDNEAIRSDVFDKVRVERVGQHVSMKQHHHPELRRLFRLHARVRYHHRLWRFGDVRCWFADGGHRATAVLENIPGHSDSMGGTKHVDRIKK